MAAEKVSAIDCAKIGVTSILADANAAAVA